MEIYTKHRFIDANDDMKSVLDVIKLHKNNGEFDKAASVARQNNDLLGDQLSASIINEIENELVKIENVAAKKKKFIYFSSDLASISKNNIWIGE